MATRKYRQKKRAKKSRRFRKFRGGKGSDAKIDSATRDINKLNIGVAVKSALIGQIRRADNDADIDIIVSAAANPANAAANQARTVAKKPKAVDKKKEDKTPVSPADDAIIQKHVEEFKNMTVNEILKNIGCSK